MAGSYKPRVVRQGDYLQKLAAAAGVEPDEVWNHPKNAELKQKRPDPDLLHPGDIIHLPDDPPAAVGCSKGATNRYKATVPRREIVVHFDDTDGPLANQAYEILGLPLPPGGKPLQGNTGSNGEVRFEVPVTVREVTVHFTELEHEAILSIGAMDPSEETSGVRKRLENLGLLPRRGVEIAEGYLTYAIGEFQVMNGLERTGVVDEATLKKLREQTTD
jgi:hypothetical protein